MQHSEGRSVGAWGDFGCSTLWFLSAVFLGNGSISGTFFVDGGIISAGSYICVVRALRWFRNINLLVAKSV